MKKRLAVVVLLGMMAFGLPLTAHAQEVDTVEGTVTISASGDVEARVIQVTWYYRTYNGKEQRRLWSITEGKWLTDWLDVN
jgi:hypothetical protein